jgi:hypothetical protein
MPTLSEIGGFIDPLAEGARNAEREIERLENRINSVSRTAQSVSQQNTQLIQMLTQSMNGMTEQVSALVASMQNLTSANSRNRQSVQQDSVTMDELFAIYKKMGVEVESLNLDLKTLTFTESEMNKVVKLGNEYNVQRTTAYDQLSRKYSAIKILLNNMTQAERESTAEGRNLVAQARDIYQQMNLLQQQTGKYQLQVGDYSKAMTGLNIATQQVVREMPVLAQSAQMFVMAISNNIPILLDNIKAVRSANIAQEALKKSLIEEAETARAAGLELEYQAKMAEANSIKTTTAMQGLLKSVMSWQTLIVLLLTVLPRVIKNIQEKKKAVEEQNKAVKEAIKYDDLWEKAMKDANSAVVDNVNELTVLNRIATDVNRTWDDRIKAAEVMKQKYEDELESLSAEEIALGRTKGAIDNLTQSLITQAEARAYLNEISELTKQRYDLEKEGEKILVKRAEAEEELNKLTAEKSRLSKIAIDEVNLYGQTTNATANKINTSTNAVNKQVRAIEDLDEQYKTVTEGMADIDKATQDLIDRIKVSGLFEEITGGGGRKGKEQLAKLGDYYFDWMESIYNLNEDEAEREYQLLDLRYARQIKAAQDRLEAERATGQLTAEQEKYQTEIIENLIEARYVALNNLVQQQEQKMRDDKYDAEIAALKDELDVRDNNAVEINKNDILQKRELLKNEIWYWKEYLKILTQNGKLTEGEIKVIQANIARAEQQLNEATPQSLLGWLGLATNTQFTRRQESNLKKMYSTATKYMNEWMDARIEAAKIAVEAAEKETEATRKMLEYEMEARANGYAYNITYARKEYEEKLKLEREAIAEQERLQRIQEQIDTATQVSSLVTATAELWASMGKAGPLAVALASAATAAMWGSFLGAKIQASQLARKKMYGEGGMEYLDYGGSHASGNDIDFGHTKDGTQRTVERGEIIGVINKRNVSKYGVHTIKGVIDSLNNGTFEDKYGLKYAMLGGGRTDLSRLEKGVDSLVSQGEKRTYVSGGKTIEVYKHSKRVILN